MPRHIGPKFRILHWCTDQLLNEALAKMDLTSSQGRIIGFIARQSAPPCCRDLEQTFQLSHPSVSGTLSRLEKKGFLEARPDPDDRRLKRLYLLPKGLECHKQIHSTIQSIEEQIVQGFTPEEKALFTDFLQRAAANMGVSPCHSNPKEESKQ